MDKLRSTPIPDVPCSVCGKKFKCEIYMKIHNRRIHNKPEAIPCSVQPSLPECRKKSQTNCRKKIKCENPGCSYEGRDMFNLRKHVASRHSTEKKTKVARGPVIATAYKRGAEVPALFACTACGEEFAQKSCMQVHAEKLEDEEMTEILTRVKMLMPPPHKHSSDSG